MKMDMGVKELFARQLDSMGDADVADMTTRPGGSDGLHHRLLRPDRLDCRVGTQTVGEVLYTCDALIAR